MRCCAVFRMAIVTLLCSAMPAAFAEDAAGPFRSSAGRFEGWFPKLPTERLRAAKTAVGSVTLHSFTARQGKLTYTIAYSDWPPEIAEDAEAMLDAALKQGVRALGGELGENEKGEPAKTAIKVGPHVGREFAFGFGEPARFARMRLVLAGNRLYQVLLISEDAEPLTSPQAERFLSSFQVVEKTHKRSASDPPR